MQRGKVVTYRRRVYLPNLRFQRLDFFLALLDYAHQLARVQDLYASQHCPQGGWVPVWRFCSSSVVVSPRHSSGPQYQSCQGPHVRLKFVKQISSTKGWKGARARGPGTQKWLLAQVWGIIAAKYTSRFIVLCVCPDPCEGPLVHKADAQYCASDHKPRASNTGCKLRY